MDQLKVLKNICCYKRNTLSELQNDSFHCLVLLIGFICAISSDRRQSGLLVDKVLRELSRGWISAGYRFTFQYSRYSFFKKGLTSCVSVNSARF